MSRKRNIIKIKRLKPMKPRNPTVSAMMSRKAGAHKKNIKLIRERANESDQRQLLEK